MEIASVSPGFPKTSRWSVKMFSNPLSVARNGPNVLISWPAPSAGYTLESTATLTSSPTWTPVTNSVAMTNGQNKVTTSIFGAARFYRLIKP